MKWVVEVGIHSTVTTFRPTRIRVTVTQTVLNNKRPAQKGNPPEHWYIQIIILWVGSKSLASGGDFEWKKKSLQEWLQRVVITIVVRWMLWWWRLLFASCRSRFVIKLRVLCTGLFGCVVRIDDTNLRFTGRFVSQKVGLSCCLMSSIVFINYLSYDLPYYYEVTGE